MGYRHFFLLLFLSSSPFAWAMEAPKSVKTPPSEVSLSFRTPEATFASLLATLEQMNPEKFKQCWREGSYYRSQNPDVTKIIMEPLKKRLTGSKIVRMEKKGDTATFWFTIQNSFDFEEEKEGEAKRMKNGEWKLTLLKAIEF